MRDGDCKTLYRVYDILMYLLNLKSKNTVSLKVMKWLVLYMSHNII